MHTIVGREAKSLGAVEGAIGGGMNQATKRLRTEAGPISGAKMTRPGSPRTTPLNMTLNLAGETAGKRARTEASAAASSTPGDLTIMQRFFPGGEIPIPALDRGSAMARAGVPVHVFDDHGMTPGWHSNNTIPFMIILSPDFYGNSYADSAHMQAALPPKMPLFSVSKKDVDGIKDQRLSVRSVGDINERGRALGITNPKASQGLFDIHEFIGAHIHTVAVPDEKGAMQVYVTLAISGSVDLAHLWFDAGEYVCMGTFLGFRWVKRTRGFEAKECKAQHEGKIFPAPSDPKLKYWRMEPWARNTHARLPREQYCGPDWTGRSIPIGIVEKMPVIKSSERYHNMVNNVCYPNEVDGIARAGRDLVRLPTIRVSVRLRRRI